MGALLAALPFAVGADGVFTPTGSMTAPRYYHTATLLVDLRVLVAGGYAGDVGAGTSASAEIYYPLAGTFAAVGDMTAPRAFHTATRLADGTVLVTGGQNDIGEILASAEIYYPDAEMFVAVGDMTTPRQYHTATRLSDGTVLIAGGYNGEGESGDLQSAEVYNPGTGEFVAVGSMATPRSVHTATLLFDDTVLVAGGSNSDSDLLASAEIYDPGSGTFTVVDNTMTMPRSYHTATPLSNGTVLLAGSYPDYYGAGPANAATAEVYDPATGTFIAVGDMTASRYYHTATWLPDGTVLVAGGYGEGSAEIYDPATGMFASVGEMTTPRFYHTATTQAEGTVLIAGGYSGVEPLASAEIYGDGGGGGGGGDDPETLIAELAALIDTLDVKHGQNKSALRRLEKLLEALDADKKNSTKKACHELDQLLKQVSGRAFMKNLTADEEAELVDRIVAIQAVIGC